MSITSDQHIKCSKSTITQIAHDIVYIDIKPNEEFTLDDYKEAIEGIAQIGDGKIFKQLIHVGLHTLPTNEARQYLTSPERSSFKLADAIVVQSLAQNIIARFIMKFQSPKVPTRVFSNDRDALLWLESI